eukprot:1037210_1
MQRDVDSKESLEEETLKAGITQSEHGFIQWKITGDLLNQFKNAKYKKVFWSPTFKAIGGEWRFGIYPNGKTTEGNARLFIFCKSIEDELILSYYVDSIGLDYSQINIEYRFGLFSNQYRWEWDGNGNTCKEEDNYVLK